MKEKKKLGRGLDAIFGENLAAALNDIKNINNAEISFQTQEVALSEIRVNPYQPRKTFDTQKLQELADSIATHGVFQPILIRKSVKGYELIAGERRLRASKLAHKETIPAVILDFNDQQMMEISLLENIQREDLNILDEAKAYKNLIEKLNYTQEELATRVAKSRVHITNTLRLLKLPTQILEHISNQKLSAGAARALLSLDDETKMLEIASKAIENNLSVRAIEKLIRDLKKPSNDKQPKINKNLEYVRKLCEQKLKTKVEISRKRFVIHYPNDSFLNAILEKLEIIEE